MAKVRFSGAVRSYSVDDKGRIHLGVEDSSPSDAAKFFVHDMQKAFDPKNNSVHGFGAKDKDCPFTPGFGTYSFVVTPEASNGITVGSVLDVEIDIYVIRKVRFSNRRWMSIPEIRYDLVSLRAAGVASIPSVPASESSVEKPSRGNR